MNILAHLYLSERTDYSVVGNMLGDFIKGSPDNGFHPEIIKGIMTHRKIDSFTDTHPVVSKCKKLFSKIRRRYAGIILDLFFDHFLANQWNTYSEISLNVFIESNYRILLKNKELFPENGQVFINKMVKEDWLGSYVSLVGINSIINRVSGRLHQENSMIGAGEELIRNYRSFKICFEEFFPDLESFIKIFQNNYRYPNGL